MSTAASVSSLPPGTTDLAPARLSRSLKLGTRIYGLSAGLILIVAVIAAIGYVGLERQGNALLDYIRVSQATEGTLRFGWEFTRVRRHMANFVSDGSPVEARFIPEHNQIAGEQIAQVASRIGNQERKVLVDEIGAEFRKFVRASDEVIALRNGLTQAQAAFSEADTDIATPQPGDSDAAARLRAALAIVQSQASLMGSTISVAVHQGYMRAAPAATAALAALPPGDAPRLQATAPAFLERAARLATAHERLRQGVETGFNEMANRLDALLLTLIERQQAFADQVAAQAADASDAIQRWMLIVAAASSLLGILLCIFVVRGIIPPLRAMTRAMVRLSAGDASITVNGSDRGDEIGDMARALDVFRRNADKIVAMMSAEAVTLEIGETITAAARHDLTVRVDLANKSGFLRDIGVAINALLQGSSDTLRDIGQSTRQVASAVAEANVAIGQVSGGARSQNTAIGQVTQALAESAKAIRMVSTSANAASEKGVMAAHMVERGQVSAEQLARTVETIAQNSRKISQITQVIAGIANRTHILSLNAAIEAARAGEHGKGFVVVAQEVGKLAESAAQNAQQITDIVEQATADAALGRTASLAVKETMDSIAGDVSQTSQMIRSIAVAMEEQQATVTQIEANVVDLRGIASGNAVAAEEITATMIQLSLLADEQRQRLETFKTS
ncbi:methyl-accepting chemotaxis protein [Humitalea rosea]|uniref:Methyl-accepting chemotaxis protein n=1 Tax=Humitalea rosea TaxID=990373 RepID=A0A2W7IJM3_9PROT|nr:HAMP domain-containing methyl-accepting chemotaxis protein [Humitalea rosea]PZW46987.1 methyl-accepting chemotaxis protein [Humitalea rosea]